MRLATLIEAVRPLRTLGDGDPEIESVTYSAGEVEPGALHVCVPGFRRDGHEFASQAVARGAVALIVEHELDEPVPQLVVESSRRAMAQAADAFFGHPSRALQMVGVTGTNGKTTTAYLLHAVLAAADRRPGLLGTIEQRVGGVVEPVARTTPESVDLQRTLRRMADAGDSSCVMEVSSHALALDRVACVEFAAAAFTNLTQDHLDFHEDMEDYYRAKARLFESAPGAVNVDDPYGRRLASEAGGPVLTYARTVEDADVRPDRLEIGEGGVISLIVRTPRGLLPLNVRLRGGFNVENVLAAVAVGEILELPHDAVRDGIAAVPGVPGRFEAVDAGQDFTLLVDYAHTPDGLRNVLESAREITQQRLICVFGCGGDRDRGKRPQMGALAAELADIAIVTSDNPRSEDPEAIIAEITAGRQMTTEPDRRAAIALAVSMARRGDVVVVAGKGHEQGQQFGDSVLPFDDVAVSREALEARGARGARLMIPLTARDVAAACAVETAANATVTGLAVDSRLVQPGDLFVALPGARTDGARFAAAARAAGATLVLTEQPGDDPAEIGVPDALIALGQVAAEVRRRSQATVVGITGSTGKTSTKDILAALLHRGRSTVKSPANHNTEIGLPLTLGLIEPETAAVVCELAMRGLGQIAYLAEICKPDVAVITNVGAAHLEQMGTIEAVAEAKAEIIPAVGPDGIVVVPHGEALLAPYLDLTRARVITFGEASGADVRLTQFGAGRAEFSLAGRTLEVPVNFTQRHNAVNLAAALAVCDGLALPFEPLLGGALEIAFSQWRGETIELEAGSILIADCYNANPTSMEAGLRHLAASAEGRRSVAVIGDMAELGPGAPGFHAAIGQLATELGIEVLAVGELARGYGGTWFASVEMLIDALPGLLQPGDAVLVKASRSVGLERVVEALIHEPLRV